MVKVQILTSCEYCEGKAYLPAGEAECYTGEVYMRYEPCPQCQGSATQTRWLTLTEFAELLKSVQCQHEHTSSRGGFHFSAGDVWDDIVEVCNDCGANLDKPKEGNPILD